MNDNAKKWVEALRSGKYKQTRRSLHDDNGFCCLGVACAVAVENGLDLQVRQQDAYTLYNGNLNFLPHQVTEWLGLTDGGGAYEDEAPNPANVYRPIPALYKLNDEMDYNFEQIADVIESEPKGLFYTPED